MAASQHASFSAAVPAPQTDQEAAADAISPEELKAYEIIAGRCYWSGNWCEDYTYHIKNWHPLISCVGCDRLNPYNKIERIAVLLVMSALTMLPSAMISDLMDSAKDSNNYIASKLATIVLVTLPIMILQYTIEYLIWFRSGFSLQSHQQYVGCAFKCLTCCTGALKSCCFCIALWMAILTIMTASWVAKMDSGGLENILHPLMISRVEAWVLWFPIDMFLPCIGFYPWWKKEKLALEREQDLERRRAAGEVMGVAAVQQAVTGRFHQGAERLRQLDALHRARMASCWPPCPKRESGMESGELPEPTKWCCWPRRTTDQEQKINTHGVPYVKLAES